jgi:hypothetical protein
MEDMEHGREEVYSKVIRAGKRTYFLDVKEMKSGDRYLTITESKRKFLEEQGKFVYEKHKIFLYQEDFEKFTTGLTQTIHFINTGERPPEEPEEQNHSQSNEKTYTANVDDIDFGV